MPSEDRKPAKALPLPLSPEATALSTAPNTATSKPGDIKMINETGGPKGAEPTRFGDWERKGRCSDF